VFSVPLWSRQYVICRDVVVVVVVTVVVVVSICYVYSVGDVMLICWAGDCWAEVT